MGHFQQNFHYLSTMGEYWASCCISTGSLLIKAVGVPLKVSSSTSYSVGTTYPSPFPLGAGPSANMAELDHSHSQHTIKLTEKAAAALTNKQQKKSEGHSCIRK